MLKKLTYISVILYLIILYGQNIFELGSDLRIDFYFIGMALSTLSFSFIIYKFEKNIATTYLFFMCIGELFNQIFFKGSISYIEILFGCVGLLYLFIKKK